MPELEFFFVDSEMDSFLEYIWECGFDLIPNLHFSRPKPVKCKTRAQVCKYEEVATSLFFLLREDFTKLPLEMVRLDGGCDEGKYFIMQREGGPAIHLFWSGVQEYEGVRFVRGGDISHYASYWNPQTDQFEKAPQAQRDAYRELTQYIKAHSVESENPPPKHLSLPSGSVVLKYTSVRIGKEAARQWADGLQLGWDDYIRRPKKVPKK